MKKTLLTLAGMTLAGAAAAQSSVTLFGTLDVGVTHAKGSIADRTQLSSTNTTASRLGFRGVEDLGNGLSAIFWLEAAVLPDDGRGANTSTNNQATGSAGGGGLTFSRRATVGLAGGWGEVRLGRDISPQSYNHIVFDPFDNKGVGGSQAYLGYAALYPGPGPHTRASNSVGYLLPATLGEFYGQAMHYLGENPSGTGTSKDGTGTAVRLGYGKKAYTIALSAAHTSYATGDVKTTNLGGSYNFGVATLSAIWDRTTVGGVAGKGYLLGAVFPIGSGDVRAAYSVFESNAAGNPEAKRFALGYRHYLSKRTALYADIARVANRGTSAQAIGGAITAAGASSSGIDVGMRHSF
jgi:predicted porin